MFKLSFILAYWVTSGLTDVDIAFDENGFDGFALFFYFLLDIYEGEREKCFIALFTPHKCS